jgi:hypothetical protein
VAQLVEYQIVLPKEVGSSHSWCFCRCRRIRSSLNLRLLCRTPCRVERRTVRRYGTAPSTPPPLYFLAGVTRGYFYGLYYFAFLECALPGVNQRPQFGQCSTNHAFPAALGETPARAVHCFCPYVHYKESHTVVILI